MQALAVLWNLPVVVFMALTFTGHVSYADFPKFAMIMCGTIPAGSLVVAFVPAIQRLLFVPHCDFRSVRTKLLGSAAFWSVITIVAWWFAV
jgi:hypothetical protein